MSAARTHTPLRVLVVGATGGLGSQLTRESLSRGHRVSVLVRSPEKLGHVHDTSTLASVFTGDGLDADSLKTATQNIDVVLNGVGSRPEIALALANAVKANNLKKLVHIAGGTNVMEDDGTHQAGIDAIRSTGVTYVVFCPGFMKSVGAKSAQPVAVKVNRFAGDFVSYEDAASVMVNAAEQSVWDGQLITAATNV
ncbi:NAD(P)-binding protein [Rhizoclosmatium globosum]|uniref:NAD(P)-binding protein n=1 Tax=Rhizoclosmatium globosum TaxID=329046 RepID=A0A1Y2CBR9_9FUNG|nr:NAD(P)-binding protein [Rhizoclosmatium globosum]|eukprot:ORY44376.1 NAD(P)-binding protein [Rhizoclosmatium globosum]